MRKLLTWILVVILGANGFFMLLAPEAWYHFIPTVPYTGPFNPHFVRDVGCAYLLCALAMLWLARSPAEARTAALGATAFLGMHAAVHVWDALAGRATLQHVLSDIPAVFLVPALMFWVAWPRTQEATR
ncbi:MAG: hypothetical protein ACT4PZ_22670 [Panacagrimonas sp.]